MKGSAFNLNITGAEKISSLICSTSLRVNSLSSYWDRTVFAAKMVLGIFSLGSAQADC